MILVQVVLSYIDGINLILISFFFLRNILIIYSKFSVEYIQKSLPEDSKRKKREERKEKHFRENFF